MSNTRMPSHGGGSIRGIQRNRSKASTKQHPIPNHGLPPDVPVAFNMDPKIASIVQEEFDEYGAELGPEARVWKAYVREADKFDMEQVDGWNRSLDVTLIFAALFTAICTAFVIESAKSLKEDATETSARRLDQITDILLVMANVRNSSEVDVNQIINPKPFSPRGLDVCINVLWFFSLILSAAVSLLAMLAKEWCYLFISGRIGDHWSQTKRRQQRWEGIKKWGMEQVIMILPSFIHLAFLSFAIGLCLYLGDLHMGVAVPAAAVTLGSVLVYAASTVLPLSDRFDSICPYSTSISRLVQRLRGSNKTSNNDHEGPGRIAIEALAWLIKSSEDPKSTDTALQAIAGADPNERDRLLLKASGADKMILRRLIGLDSYSKNYDQIMDLYTRAQSFFQTTATSPAVSKGTSTPPREKAAPGSHGEPRKESTAVPQKKLNRELQRKLRNLRDTIDRKITVYATSDPAFLPTTDNIQALRIGSTAASYCLQSLQNGIQAQTQEQFDSVIDLLESYKEGEAHLNAREIQYLMTGTAMLLSSLLVECPVDIGAQYVMRLLRIAGRVKDGEKQLRLDNLRLPLVVYALSRRDYPGWIRPPPLSPISRLERAIDMITHYVSHPFELDKVSSIMVNLGLLELLSDPEGYKLDDRDIIAISEAFDPKADDGGQALIHTFLPNSQFDIYSSSFKSMATMISNGRHGLLSKESGTIACLTVLNRTRMDYSTEDAPLGQVYAFLVECVLNLPSSDPEAYGQSVALDLLRKFHDPNYSGRGQDVILDLARSLGDTQVMVQLKNATELSAIGSDADFIIKLFATGQAWFLIELVIESKTAAHQEWKCLSPFVGDEGLWDSPADLIARLKERRSMLAESYNVMWKNDTMRRHPYFGMLHDWISPAKASPLSVTTQLTPVP